MGDKLTSAVQTARMSLQKPLNAQFLLPLAVGLIYYVLAALALDLTQGSEGIATIWPSSGVAVAALLLASPSQRPIVYLTILIASFLSNYGAGMSAWQAGGFTIANLVEAYVAIRLMNGTGRSAASFTRPTFVARFCLAAIAAGALSGLIASVFAGIAFASFFQSWWTTVSLGIMLVVPPAVILAEAVPLVRKGIKLKRVLRTTVMLGIIAVVSWIVFWQVSFPLLWVTLLGVMIATYVSGPPGASLSVLIIAIIGSYATVHSEGQISLGDVDRRTTVLFFQIYLLTLLASALPFAALLARRERQLAETRRGNRLLGMAERAAKVGHWRYAMATGDLFFSRQTYRIHGLSKSGPFGKKEALRSYHPEDRLRAESNLRTTMESGEPTAFEARLMNPDGSERHVYVRAELEKADDGKPVAIFGIIQDVTDQVASRQELEEARSKAVAEAAHASMLAETDQLTGVANRRKAMAVLEEHVANCSRMGGSFAVIMLDVDRFKSINDAHGHVTGDIVLQRIVETCCATLRDSDFIGRMGGEEFLMILPGVAAEGGAAVAERARSAVENIRWSPLELRQVTVSMGLSVYESGKTAPELLQAADHALYRAKNQGRNLLCLAA